MAVAELRATHAARRSHIQQALRRAEEAEQQRVNGGVSEQPLPTPATARSAAVPPRIGSEQLQVRRRPAPVPRVAPCACACAPVPGHPASAAVGSPASEWLSSPPARAQELSGTIAQHESRIYGLMDLVADVEDRLSAARGTLLFDDAERALTV
jgi:hypothetical protein